MPNTTLAELFDSIDTVCQEASAVTAACLATLRSDADEVTLMFWTTDGDWIGDIFVPSAAAVAAMAEVA